MFGSNKILGLKKGDGSKLDVVEIFKTIQGEGPYAGIPAIFIRLGGCNLACKFCDTEFDNFREITIAKIIAKIIELGQDKINLCVITGGEPLRQPIEKFCTELLAHGFKIQIETNGTILRKLPEQVTIICSPKNHQGKYNISSELINYADYFKFIISKNNANYDHIPEIKAKDKIFIQPMDEYDQQKNMDNLNYTSELALKHNYRISLQTHKILGVR